MTTAEKTKVSTISAIENHRGEDLDAASVYETLINQALTEKGTINKAIPQLQFFKQFTCLLPNETQRFRCNTDWNI